MRTPWSERRRKIWVGICATLLFGYVAVGIATLLVHRAPWGFGVAYLIIGLTWGGMLALMVLRRPRRLFSPPKA